LAVVVTVAKGYDLDYIWKTQAQASPERTTGGYYINAAQAGEPPGRWWGPGAQALGFTEGEVVERDPYDAVYQQIDPRTGEKLGRPRGSYLRFADHLARLTAAGPHATAERLIELETRGASGHPPACRLHRRHGLVFQVHLGPARLDPGERTPCPADGRPAGSRLLEAAGREVSGGPAPGEPGDAGVPAGLGRGDAHRLPRHPHRWPRTGPLRGSRGDWITPGILEALIPGRIQGHGGTAEVPGGAA
jgi:hypothetical protein